MRVDRLALARILVALGLLILGAACNNEELCAGEPVTTDSGLRYEDIECGEGEAAARGDHVTVHYVGTFEEGEQFDSSRGSEPFEFRIGVSGVIEGWHEGVAGMRVGGVRELTIPPQLGYGESGSPPVIPPNATLIFEIELLAID